MFSLDRGTGLRYFTELTRLGRMTQKRNNYMQGTVGVPASALKLAYLSPLSQLSTLSTVLAPAPPILSPNSLSLDEGNIPTTLQSYQVFIKFIKVNHTLFSPTSYSLSFPFTIKPIFFSFRLNYTQVFLSPKFYSLATPTSPCNFYLDRPHPRGYSSISYDEHFERLEPRT